MLRFFSLTPALDLNIKTQNKDKLRGTLKDLKKIEKIAIKRLFIDDYHSLKLLQTKGTHFILIYSLPVIYS